MDAKLTADNQVTGRQHPAIEPNPENAIQERLLALELQLRIFKQAESIGEIGNWQINLNTFETWYSDNVFRIYGLEPFAVKSHPATFNGFLHEEDRKVVLTAFEKSYTEKIPLHLEFRIRKQDGKERHIKIVSSVTKNPQGEPLLTGITQDITDRKNLEIKFRESIEKIEVQNEAFRHAEQIGLFGTWEVNLNTRLARYSDNYFRIFGQKPGGLHPGLNEFTRYVHPDDQPIFKAVIKKIFEAQLPPDAEFRILRNDARTRYVRLKSKLLKNADGDPLIVGVIKDMTAATKLENQLKEINEQLQLQNEAFTQAEKTTDIGSWTWNLHTNKVQFSDHIYTLYGLKPQSVIPSLESFDQFIHPMDRPAVQRIIAGMRQEPVELDYSCRVVRPDGKVRHIRTRSQPITSPDGHLLIIGTTQDITDDVLLNQQLKARIHFAEMLSENTIDKVCITNSSNIIIGWNSNAEIASQLSKEEVLGRNIFEVLPKLKHKDIIAVFNKALSGEVVKVPQVKLPYLEGHHELTMIPIREEKEEVTAVLTLLHDISEHLELKSELEERLAFIERLVESSVDRILVLDRNMTFLYWNKKCEDYYSLSKEKVIGKNILEVFPSFRKEMFFEKMKKAWNGETLHAPVDRESAASNYSESFLVPIKNSSQQVVAVLWIEHDLTELILAEKDLKRSRDILQSVFDTSFTGIAVFESIRNEAGEIIDFEFKLLNEYAQSIFGDELKGKSQLEVYHGAKNEGFFELNKQVVETGIPVDTEKYYSGEGLSGWFRITAAKMGDGLVVGLDDISERKRTDEQMMKQRSLLLQAEEIANLGSWEFNPTTETFAWSDQVYRIYDYAPQSFVPTFDFYLNTTEREDREMVSSAFQAAKDGEPFSIMHRLHTLDGRSLYVLLKGQPAKDEFGLSKVIIGTLQDITDQHQIKEQLKIKNDTIRLQHQVDRQLEKVRQAGSWQWNLNTNEITWGESMFYLFGQEPFSIQPTLDWFLSLVHPDDKDKMIMTCDEVKDWQDNNLPPLEFRAMVNDEVRYFRSAARKISNGLGNYVVGSTIDFTEDAILQKRLAERMNFVEALIESSVTDRIAAERELRELNVSLSQKNKELHEMNEELTSFAFIASHDLREPLRKLQFFSDRILQRDVQHLSDSGKDEFNRIQVAAKRMEDLIDDMLTFSSIHSFETFIAFDLENVLQDVKREMSQLIREKQAIIEHSPLPAIEGKPSHFGHLFRNLLSNSLKFQPVGQQPIIKIEAREINGSEILHPDARPDDIYLQISITDNGIGFEQQYEQRIFQMFQRLHGMHEFSGTGMGLAICKKVAHTYQGFITASSSPGKGARFCCYFKLKSDLPPA